MGMNMLEARRRVMMAQPHIETLVGNPVSFKAEALPLQELKVAITPVQDLHGQDSPYPPGGGKNKWSGDATFSKSDDSLNVEVSISIQAGTYNLSGVFTSGDTTNNDVTFRFRSGSSTIVYARPTANSGARTNVSFTLSSACDNVLVYGGHGVSASDKFAATYTNVMIENGSTATDYAPFANICPISGHTGVNVSRTGKNVFGGSAFKSALLGITGATEGSDSDGSYVTFAGSAAINIIELFNAFQPNKQYTIILKYKKNNMVVASNIGLDYTDGSRTYINSSETAAEGKLYTAVISTNATKSVKALTAIYASGSTSMYYDKCGVFEGVLTETNFEAYVGTTYPITWETAAGTVYGGTLDVLNGVLTVDRASETITKDSIWYGFNTGTGNSSAVVQLTDYLNVYYNDGSSSRNGSVSSTGKEAQNYWINARQNEVPDDGDMCFAYSSTGQLRFHRTDVSTITDITTFKSSFPDTQIVYKLATPTTFTLSAQQISSLLGMNNLWNDINGDNTVSFYTH